MDILTVNPCRGSTFSSCSFAFETLNENIRSEYSSSNAEETVSVSSANTSLWPCSSEINAAIWSVIFVKYLQVH